MIPPSTTMLIPPSTTITDRGRRIRRTLLWLAGGVIALNLLIWGLSSLSEGGAVSGPDGSSFVTTRSGAAAAAGMLERLGIRVERARVPLDEVELDRDTTVAIVDVGSAVYGAPELNHLEEFLRAGGRLVVAGQADFVERLLPDAPLWRSEGAEQANATGDLVTTSVGSVRLGGFGSLTGADTPFLVADDLAIGMTRPVGEGELVWLADSFPFHNQGIGQENAAVLVASLLDPQGPVVFDEYRHGYRLDGGLWAVIPPRWRLALLLGGVTAVLALAAYGRRLGPPHDIERRLPPGREAYLDSISGIMSRGNARDDAAGVMREEALRRLSDRTDSSDPKAAARAAGLSAEETAAITGDGSDDDTLLALDRALATLTGKEGMTWTS